MPTSEPPRLADHALRSAGPRVARTVGSVLAATALWLLWGLCVLLVIPVLLNVPGNPRAWEIGLYLAVLGAVTSYPILLPVLVLLKRRARRRAEYVGVARIRTMLWLLFGAVMTILATLCVVAYAHERARPVLSRQELFANSYANAILRHDTAWMDRLLAQGAEVDQPLPPWQQTPATMSAGFGDWSLVLFLLERGADPDRADAQGRSVRTLAAAGAAPTTATEAQALASVRMRLRQPRRRASGGAP